MVTDAILMPLGNVLNHSSVTVVKIRLAVKSSKKGKPGHSKAKISV